MPIKNNIKKFVPQSLRNYYHFLQSFLSNVRYGFPWKKLKLIGVTGTDGKTTTVNLIYHFLKSSGFKVSMISTIKAIIGNKEFDTGFHVTTPDPWLIPQYMNKAVKAGSEYMVLEVTSHALDQHRMAGLKYDVGVLTNITHEHLDYHKTYDKYLQTKTKLLKSSKIAILNADDEPYNKLESLFEKKRKTAVVSYGIEKEADVEAQNVVYKKDSTEFVLSFDKTNLKNRVEHKKLTKKKLVKMNVVSSLIGDYNVSNMLAAMTACLSLDIEPRLFVTHAKSFKTLNGRLEDVKINSDFRVIVDFAHTPGAFSKVLPVVKNLVPKGKLIHIFGSAGLRDDTKRPLMGEMSGKFADVTIITAEDPRTERVEDISVQIEAGCQKSGMTYGDHTQKFSFKKKTYFKIPDRSAAIEFAITKLAVKGDIVLITGKGHEKSMCFGTTETPWSDFDAVKKILKD
ncbi:hypothetical protein A2X44_01140 [candidate division CPR3 bacterium GWF2_35_18]|uniref:UDP-N-acetylmuramyl-tripeptide synthetase n=1 Tax=candidate division CPR3 bacterium GW2011_GWF2_35_18 TaxID=1618350 RepID=A0A0G0ESK6_UNCC3|nr:MAG: UDP-N-acetylmuramyl-tripeptide synthetase [candidate division CPR3 bacterium GW2011_GWF2_35_18]KKP85554.1 MAG: UDP-N-acetylmuramyl-tripeptide synthetase [candidate division CPR3 bacterium GW2011_GWE2_35_7]OGB63507.1 MAG: hypothetical protein A2X44_01140 [candidate division CPR3 bacterium GWF2_35_18]OGB64748.1 MAG: hypothetical protein A2250_04885 [candidate division CPR3 bacterium RIFOXYA2_FULL_35_13]OGB75934.1 MAG: hypothetical protein A2476_02855 [candidate division CPR3 bacterium RIF